MTSKEALKDMLGILMNFERLSDIHDEQDIKKQKFEIIEKDLDLLEEHRKIEDELGIDLITFHKALKNGVYYKVINKDSLNCGKIFFDKHVLWGWNIDSYGNYFAMMQSQMQTFNLKDYGKTWALTREELEK